MLERDVAEGEVSGVVGQVERAAVGDLDRAQPVDLAEPADRLVAALEEARIEVAGDHRAELAGEGARHAADAGADLDQRAGVVVGSAQTEGTRGRPAPRRRRWRRTRPASAESPASLLNTQPVSRTTSSAVAICSDTRPAVLHAMCGELAGHSCNCARPASEQPNFSRARALLLPFG